jgi:hypothetical protein
MTGVPADQDVNVAANCELTIPNLVSGSTATDNCTVSSITQSPTAGSTLTAVHNGTYTVVVTATDAAGNSSSSNVVLTAKDVTNPVLTAEADQDVNVAANCELTIPNLVDGSTATDNCTVSSITQNPSAGSTLTAVHNGTYTVVVTATDAAGNSSSSNVVLTAKDVTAPVITCPTAFTHLVNSTGCLYNGSIGTPTATDNCSIVSIVPTPAGPYPAGVTTVTWTATDAGGNTSTCTQTVTITKEPVVILATSSTNLYTNDLLDMEITSPTGGSAYGWAGPSGGSLSSTDEFLSGTVSSIDSGIYVATVTDALGCVNTASILVQVHASAVVRLKALLSGPYVATAGLMHDSLRTYGIIPITDPYTAAPFNTIFPQVGMPSPSSSVDPSVFIPTGPDAIVDWVFIQLRSAANASTVVATRSALIQRDGDIVALDGVSPVTFQGTYPGSYFVTVKHRNHLGIMTAGSINILENGTAVDFTNPGTPLYLRAAPNNNPSPLSGAVRVTGGKNVMYAGNCNLGGPSAAYSRYITYSNSPVSDRTTLFAAVGLSGSFNGYSVLDVDMSGSARFNGFNPDRVVILLNCANNSSGLIVHEQTPN